MNKDFLPIYSKGIRNQYLHLQGLNFQKKKMWYIKERLNYLFDLYMWLSFKNQTLYEWENVNFIPYALLLVYIGVGTKIIFCRGIDSWMCDTHKNQKINLT